MRAAILLAGVLLATPALAQSPGTLALPTGQQQTAPQVNAAVNAALSLKADTANPVFTGNLFAVTGMAGDQLNLTKTYDIPLAGSITGDPHQAVSLATLSVPATKQVWNNFDNFKYIVPGGDASPLSAVVTRYIQMERRTDALLVPSWPLIVSSNDFTNHPSSVAGPAIGMELDLETSGPDDQTTPFGTNGSRSMLTMVALRGRTYGGTDSQIAQAISIFSDPSKMTFKSAIRVSTGWSTAALDTSGGVQGVGAVTIKLAAGQKIALDAAATRTLSYDSASGKLFFAVAGANVFSIDTSGNVKAAGTVTASTTP